MERETRIKTTLNGNPNSLHYRSFAPKNSPKDPSFSTYLKPEPPKIGPGEDIVGGNIDDSDQISVFEAENYFSESTDQKEKTKHIVKTENNVDLESSIASSRLAYRVNSFHATPTASSEASWNSQTGLLTNPQGSAPISLRTFPNDGSQRSSRKVKNWFLMRKCPCFGNKSIQVQVKPPYPESNSSVYGTKNSSSSPSDYNSIKTQNPPIFEPKKTQNPPIFEPKKTQNPPIFEPKKTQNPPLFEPKKSPNPPSLFDPKKNPIRGIHPTNVPQTQPSHSLRSSFTINEQNPDPISSNFRRFSSENRFPTTTHLRSSNNGNGFQFSFPILNSQFNNQTNPNPNPHSLDDPPRQSLEVFQPATDSGGRVRRNYPFPASPMSRIASTEDDVASDASSDLFEIETLSTATNTTNVTSFNNNFNFNLNSMEENPAFSKYRPSIDSVAATECYAPSEASVEWSVATAEGFDRGSVANFSASVSQVDFGTKYSGGDVSDTWHGLVCRGEKDVCVARRVGKEGGGTWGSGRDGFGYKGW